MTRRFCFLFALAMAAGPGWCGTLKAATTNAAPDFKEIYNLLHANLPGATDDTLNRAAVEGMLSQFHDQVSLVGVATNGAAVPLGGAALSKSAVIESNVAYLRVSRVTAGLADELGAACRALAVTNKIAGVVLDLRFAGGDDDAAAQAAAKLFAAKKIAAGPLAVLVNGETRGAAAMLAAALRQAGTGLILGSPTAGQTIDFKEFTLSNGERLRITTAPLNSSGGPAGTANGIQPDITVAVNADDERAFWENPYGVLVAGNTNSSPGTTNFLPFVEHTSEADLVRQRRKSGKLIKVPTLYEDLIREKNDGGDGNEDSALSRAAGPQKPVIRDPVLARAVDLIKGLAVVRGSRP